MKIKLYWPNCNYINKKWVNKKIDSFWVGCTYEEAKSEVFPYLSLKQIKDVNKDVKSKPKEFRCDQIETDIIYFLVSKDLKSLMQLPWFYPYSGHWNGYCPFEEIKEVEIKELKELLNIIINE